jgi:hypothetical protein
MNGIHRLELGRVGQEIHDDLMAAYNFRVDREAAEWLRAFLKEETKDVRRTYDPAKDKPYVDFGEEKEEPVWTEAPLKGEEAARPIAFTKGDTLRALEVIDEMVFQPSLIWPVFDSVTDVEDLCDSALYYRVQLREAKRLGIDKRPEIKRQILDKERWMYMHAYRRVKIMSETEPTEEELHAAYDGRIEEFSLPERRRFHLFNTASSEHCEIVPAARRSASDRRRPRAEPT